MRESLLKNPRDAALEKSPTLFAMGFRPFFLLASLYAVISLMMWMHVLGTGQNPSQGYLSTSYWHAHEMIFGFTLAVVAGFLLTAARNWTKLNTLHGYPLAAFATLWFFGRLSLSTFVAFPPILIATLNIAFPATLMLIVARVVVRAKSKRNYGILVMLSVFTITSALIHLEALGVTKDTAQVAIYAALHFIVLLTVVIGGRIIPLFTKNKLKVDAKKVPLVDRAAIAASALVAIVVVVRLLFNSNALDILLGFVATSSSLLHIWRMKTWKSKEALRVPMLAVLHAGYLWIAIGHFFVALAAIVPAISMSVAIHALTIGVIGTMTLGMMARVSLGHTGRNIVASKALTYAFAALSIATVARLSVIIFPDFARTTWNVAGIVFVLAFATLFFVVRKPLIQKRPDGKPG